MNVPGYQRMRREADGIVDPIPSARVHKLTPRRKLVVEMYARGLTMQEIATILKREYTTVLSTRTRAMRDLGIAPHRLNLLVRAAIEAGLVARGLGAGQSLPRE